MSRTIGIFGLAATLLALTAAALGAQAITYSHQEVAPGVSLFRPSDAGLGNVVAVISDGEALVVDATGTPAAALQVLAGLRTLGVSRVLALVNTHWHDDHIWGNQVFADSFPQLGLVAHAVTVDAIRDRAAPGLVGQISRLHERIEARDRELDSGLKADGTPLDSEERARLEQRQALFRDAVGSLESVRPTLPTPLRSSSRTFDVGRLEVRVEHLGGGHTPGDLVVRVPATGVVIAGDLLTRPVPAAAEADLSSWVTVLERMDSLAEVILIPGHGPVESDRAYLRAVRVLFQEVIAFVQDGVDTGEGLEQLIETADFSDFGARWLSGEARENAMFRAFFVEPAIRSTHARLSGG